jgi:hypothetical protein
MARPRTLLAARWRAALGTTRPRIIAGAGGLLAAVALVLGLSGLLSQGMLGLCISVLGALHVAARYALAPRTPEERTALRAPLVVLFVGALSIQYSQSLVGMYAHGMLRTWNVYHYYLGSKYFDELGYTDLYAQTIVADREQGHRLRSVRQIRDMSDYQVRPVEEVVGRTRSPAFSEARWREFKRDLDVLLPREPRELWDSILTDRGYNPTPCWNAAVSAVSRRLDITHHAQLMVGTSIDLLLYVTMFVGLGWAFGMEAAMLSFLAFAFLPFTPTRLVGGFVQYDWLAAIALGLCFVHKRRPVPAAIALGYATVTRVFPLLLVAGLALPTLRRLWTERRLDRFTRRFALTFVAACALGVAVGATSGKGAGGWVEWNDKIQTHNAGMTFGMGRVGLRHLFTHRLGGDFEPTEEARRDRYERQRPAYYAAAAAMVVLFVVAAWRRSKLNSLLLAMLLIYALFVPSHYYWSILAFLPLWRARSKPLRAASAQDERRGWAPDAEAAGSDEPGVGATATDGKDEPWSPALLPALSAFVVPAGWYLYARTEPFQYAQYLRFDWLLGACWLAICGSLLWADWRRRARPAPSLDSS